MRRNRTLLFVPIGLAVIALLAASAAMGKTTASDTLVFGTASDPVVLDGPLVSDGESLRPIDQIFEGLVGLKPGTTQVVPALATSWKASKNGLNWTFTLRQGVKFQDGTNFNAAAVCFSFSRWYNFPGPLQSDAVSTTGTRSSAASRIRRDESGPDRACIRPARPRAARPRRSVKASSSFIGALALTNFGMASPAR